MFFFFISVLEKSNATACVMIKTTNLSQVVMHVKQLRADESIDVA